MLEQVGPKRVWRELKDQAPYYAKMLPDMPRLLHGYLSQRPSEDLRREMRALVAEQQRTNRLLKVIASVSTIFLLGLIALFVFARLQWF